MNKIALLAASMAFFAATGLAQAADAIVSAPPAPPAAPVSTVYDWTGFYLGVEGGYVWTNLEYDPTGEDEDFNGGLLGGHAGYNWQSGSFVVGIEGNVDYTWNENDYAVGAVTAEVGTDWQASLRARVGYAFDRALLYGTGGVAITRGYIDTSIGDEDQVFTGWTLGAGLEYAFTQNWTGRIEYRYSDYGSDDFDLGLGDLDLTEHAVRLGVSYKF